MSIQEAPSALEAARNIMTTAAMAYTAEGNPRGCLLASATASGSSASTDVQQAVADVRRGVQNLIAARINEDVLGGALPPDIDPLELSGLVMAVMQGMSVLARDGASRANLLAIVRAAMRAWPMPAT